MMQHSALPSCKADIPSSLYSRYRDAFPRICHHKKPGKLAHNLPPPVSWQLAENTAYFHSRKNYLERCLVAFTPTITKIQRGQFFGCVWVVTPHTPLSAPHGLRHPVCFNWINEIATQYNSGFILFCLLPQPCLEQVGNQVFQSVLELVSSGYSPILSPPTHSLLHNAETYFCENIFSEI